MFLGSLILPEVKSNCLQQVSSPLFHNCYQKEVALLLLTHETRTSAKC